MIKHDEHVLNLLFSFKTPVNIVVFSLTVQIMKMKNKHIQQMRFKKRAKVGLLFFSITVLVLPNYIIIDYQKRRSVSETEKIAELELPAERKLASVNPKNSSNFKNELETLYPKCEEIWTKSASYVTVWSAIQNRNHVLRSLTNNYATFPTCEEYFRKRKYLYTPNAITEDEKNFPIAFSLLVYHNFDQLEQLLMSVYRKNNFYCLHVDNSAHWQFRYQVAIYFLSIYRVTIQV